MKKTILITGGSKGIGLALARIFHSDDYQVIICARGREALTSVEQELPGIDTRICDMSDISQVKQLATSVIADYGKLDVLINNAGVFQPGQIQDESDEIYELMMRTNMDSAYYLTKGVLPSMIDRQTGTIVNMASIASIQAYPNGGSYSISKFALLGFSKNLREELKPHGIRVISVMPGATFTASWEGVDVPEDRLMPSEDVANLIWSAVELSKRTVVEDLVLRPQLGDL
ncbi:SDR family oxidoreductase [Pontibacter sp. G13]|uniref:SDR family oxidoreductase n=1 Tax=Pontibacter sp. G13 TaxID=3074898 RepID=UPI00288A5974|nr:SDR family oxidoreductase [Pontibacter sp. G13]WNJ18762.1 SDR family oxidoreductase [Pontibacter sp. G13]